jgi:hypothetical protein
MSDQELFHQVAGFVFDYILTSKPRDVGSPNAEKLVEYGVAQFGNYKDIVADEPLALLAVMHYSAKEMPWSLSHFLLDSLCTSNESAWGVAFEHFCAYQLALAFKSPTCLSAVFNFVVLHPLQD